jgi:rsbT co-antagonist protein RsbR
MDSTDETIQSVRAENERLRLRVAELEAAAAGREPPPEFLEQLIDEAPLAIYAKDRAGRYILVNRYLEAISRRKRELILGKTPHELVAKADADSFVDADLQVIATGEPLTQENMVPVGGEKRYLITSKYPLRDASGEVFAVCGISTEVTNLTRGHEENQRLQAEIIRAQEESLRALSTPLLPIAPGVVLLPLIGAIDRVRAELVLDALLRGVSEHRASTVIMDITGVPVVDAAVASTLVQGARAVKLLGAEAVLTGVRPSIAQTLVSLGADLDEIVIKGTLQGGVAYALAEDP